jgi:hypothetical protein
MAGKEEIEALFGRAFRMSAADISVLEVGGKRPGTVMTTPEGSDNDLLWSELCKLDWMKEGPPLALPDQAMPVPIKTFEVTDAGQQPVSILVFEWRRRQQRPEPPPPPPLGGLSRILGRRPQSKPPSPVSLSKGADDGVLADLCNRLPAEILPKILTPVVVAGGKKRDFLVVFAAITAAAIQAYDSPNGDDAALDDLVRATKSILAQRRAGT